MATFMVWFDVRRTPPGTVEVSGIHVGAHERTAKLLCHTHIPKAAGTAFIRAAAAAGHRLVSYERCLSSSLHDCGRDARSVQAVLLRSPRELVLAQYVECAYGYFGRTGAFRFPRHKRAALTPARL